MGYQSGGKPSRVSSRANIGLGVIAGDSIGLFYE